MDPNKTYANGAWNGACPKCGGRERQGAQVRKGGRMYVRSSSREYKRGMRYATRIVRPSLRVYYQEVGTGNHAVFGGPTRRFAACDHPWHVERKKGDPLASSNHRSGGGRKRRRYESDTMVVTPATTINIHSKDSSRRKAKARQEKAHQGKGRR